MNMTPLVMNLSKMKGRNNALMILMIIQFGLLIFSMFSPKAMLEDITRIISIFDGMMQKELRSSRDDESLLDESFQRR